MNAPRAAASPQSPAIVETQLTRIRAFRWLSPDVEMEAQTDAARQWLDDRMDEHAAALAPFLPPALHGWPHRVAVVRSMREALKRWEADWEQEGASGGVSTATAWLIALAAAAALVEDDAPHAPPADLRDATRHRALEALRQARINSPTAIAMFPEGVVGSRGQPLAPPGEVVAMRHVAWTLAFGLDPDRPSPWAPLLDIWERGGWPLMMPSGNLLVFVPMLRDGGIVPEPERLEQRTPPLRRVRPATSSSPFPSLESLGAGPPPTVPLREAPPAPLDPPSYQPVLLGRIAPVTPWRDPRR